MPNIKSAIKRVDVTSKKTLENKMIKSQIATMSKKVKTLVADGDVESAKNLLPEVIALIDSACSKGVLHSNNAARKVSKLTVLVNSAN